jgi:hypothetical protein
MVPLGREWRQLHMDEIRKLQKYMSQPAPEGYGVLYAIVKKIDDEKAYIGKANSNDEGARYRAYGRNGHIKGVKGRKSVIHDAMKAHGNRNFIMFVFKLVPEPELNQAEKAAIKEFNTLTKSQGGNGYNIMGGGDGGRQPQEVIERTKQTKSKPLYKKRMGDSMVTAWTDPKKKANLVKSLHKRWEDPERRAVQSTKRKVIATKTLAERIAHAYADALPWVVAKQRIKGAYYRRPNGTVGRWDGNQMKPLCQTKEGREMCKGRGFE